MGMNGGKGNMLGLLLLKFIMEYRSLESKPPVTAAIIAVNTLIYLRPSFLHPIVPTIDRILFNSNLILKNKDLKRFLLSAFYHLGEPHLVFNMLSLLWKGVQLESALGSIEFAKMVSTLVVMSQGMSLLLAKILLIFGYDHAYYNEFSAGFSGVLFAMKVVMYSGSYDYTYVQGISVPARYAAWAELLVIQILVPRVSFLGHLGGILAGLLYVYINSDDSNSGSGLFGKIVKGLTSFLRWPLRIVRGIFWRSSPGRIYGSGRVGRTERMENGVWRCSACTYDNLGRLSACEMCGTNRGSHGAPSSSEVVPLEESRLRETHGVSSSSETLRHEELRRLRLRRFGR